MLYLFGSGAWDSNRKVMKVGFTDNMEDRKVPYNLYNPLGVILNTREGDEILETKLQLRLYEFKAEFLDEWFLYDPEIFDIFEEDENDIDEWLWKNKHVTLCYPQIPLPGTKKRLILDSLRNKFSPSNIEGEKLL